VVLAEFGTGQVLWSLLWIFLFVVWFWLLIVIFGDIFRSDDLSGWGKALWTIFVLLFPFVGILVYLIVRGKSMQERAIASAKAQQASMDEYVRQTARGADPAAQIEKAKTLLDSGAISQAEFDELKRKALA
jgi:type VI protein secretion system component VasK